MTKEGFSQEGKRRKLTLFVVMGAALVCLAEALSVAAIFRRHELHLEPGPYIYLLPILVVIPLISGLRFATQMKKTCSPSEVTQEIVSDVWWRLAALIGGFYAVLVMMMIFLLSGLRPSS